jgi:transcriptional regulator with GAF, ATPase, and Fis domain
VNEVLCLPLHDGAQYEVDRLALDVQRALSACATFPSFLATLSDQLPRLLPARDRVSLAFLEPDGAWMRVYRVLPAFDSPPSRLPRVRVEGTVVGHVALDGKSRVVSDVWQDPQITFGHASHDGIRSTASVPITIAGRVVGVMNIGSRTPGACHAKMLDTLTAVAAIVGPAVFAAERVFLERPLTAPAVKVEAPEPLVGASPAFRAVLRAAKRAATTDVTVLITGETGVGKTTLARAVHGWSQRGDGPFVRVHAAELTGSADGGPALDLQAAARGSLFLDEIADAPLAIQARLVRLMPEPSGVATGQEAGPRFIATTQRDLHQVARAGAFRDDLLFRLDVVTLHLPPLRDRMVDLEPIVESVLARLSARHGGAKRLTEGAWQRLRAHRWPGNVRELEGVLLRAALLEDLDELTLDGWRPATSSAVSATPQVDVADWPTRDEQERRYLRRVLELSGGTIEGPRGAARRLDMQPSTLRSRLKRLGVNGAVARGKDGG